MEFTGGQNHKFNLASVSELALSSSRASDSPAGVRVRFESEAAELRSTENPNRLFKLSPVESVCISEGAETSKEEEELYEIDVPLKFIASMRVRIHGLAC
ncbi:probable histone-arginine methyltransferase 1.4 isoform X2 [Actinidia eriantha]|uniref:probable histone-arginine methyltransferase 1.4 isoform X2 n=1 Tax=Actinidia eriantha TaxID=165200 RepID=UPI00258DD890|nr:probable histone-arginine methyltransferase 1.4 isoform X2 [Actinidia eriantha]